MRNNEWLQNRLDYLRGLRKPTAQQQLLMALADLPQRSSKEQRRLDVLVRAERFAEKAQKARGEANRVLSEEQRQLRKKRDHALYRAAGLLGVAGIVDTVTGELLIDAGVLVGALVYLTEGGLGDLNRFKASGDRLIADREAKRQGSPEGHNEAEPEA
ncbi:TPA: conjugal transfer protein TraD [Serratia marcescens]|jgi:fructose-1,6-bisphosphatase